VPSFASDLSKFAKLDKLVAFAVGALGCQYCDCCYFAAVCGDLSFKAGG
jgi:hypothetical protein